MNADPGAGGGGGGNNPGGGNAPWYGEIPADRPQEFREWVQSKNFADPVTALEAFWNTNKLLGVPAEQIIRLPKADDAQAWEGVWNKLGRPDKPEAYELPVPVGEDGKPNEADVQFSQFVSGIFHKAGVPKSMAQAIAQQVNEYSANQAKAYREQLETQAKQELEALKQEWGTNYDKNAEFAKRGLAAYGKKAGLDSDDLATLENALGTAKMLKLFVSLGETTAEADLGGGGGGGPTGMTPAQAKTKLDELRMQRIENKITQDEYLEQVEKLAPIATRAA